MTEKGTAGTTYFKTSINTFSRKLTGSISPQFFKLSVKNFSNGKTVSETLNLVDSMETSNLGCFFIWSTEYVGETDFEQLILSLSNEIGNPL